MSGWLRVAVPLGIAAVVISVLVIGFGSPSSLAAKPAPADTEVAGCDTYERTKGNVPAGSSVDFSMTLCSDPDQTFVVYVSWGRYKADKDLALLITDPEGKEWFVDNDPSAAELFIGHGPLAEGTWHVQVINEGTRNCNFNLSMGFG
jgi:hypothetical protein